MEYLGPGAEGVSPQAAAGIFVERLKTGDLGDRRDALDALLKLSEDHATEVGSAGMPVFTDILQAGIADHAMTQTIMGIMLNLVAEREGTGTGANVEAFLKDIQNVQNLLDLLSSKDVLTTLSAVQVLQALQAAAADSLEDCILECPAGLQALVEVLRDPREEVRNEVILLLGQLTSSNLEVKKFVAFQEGFERLFDIMSGEGMLEGGGVIVKDCLDVCLNLLTGSSLTKTLFCESNCLKRFHQLIDVRTADGGSQAAAEHDVEGEANMHGEGSAAEAPLPAEAPSMSEMQSEIACKALDLLLHLLQRDDGAAANESDSKITERQSAVAGAEEGLLSEMLAHVAFSRAEAFSHSPIACRERAMKIIGALVDGHPRNQYNMGELLVQDVGSGSLALATLVMEGALGEGGADPAVNETFHWVLGCFFHGNELGCAQVVSHVIAPPPPPLELDDVEAWVPPIPPGKVLLKNLVASATVLFQDGGSGEPGAELGAGKQREMAAAHAADVISRGCMILSMLFRHGGGATKEIALRVPLAPAPGAHPATLLHSVFLWLELATSRPRASATVTGDAPSSRNGGAEATGESLPPGPGIPKMEFVGQARADAGISLLRLLCRWVHGCPAAVHELLENPANLFFVDVAAGKEEEGGGARAGEVSTGATAVQLASVKGLSCLLLGILLESVESASAPKSGGGGGGGGGEWTRDLIMKMIQNRVGMTPFMASIEATKRAFGEEAAAQRRRHRTARERNGSGGSVQGPRVNVGALRLDPNFTPLLDQAGEEVRRRVITIFTHGDGGVVREDGTAASPGAENGGDGASPAASVAGLASVVEMQEREIEGLREELSEALSRVPQGGKDGGGMSALEEALRNRVTELAEASVVQSSEMDSLREELGQALDEMEEEKGSTRLLTSELEGLSLTIGSLERQLTDRESDCDSLRRQVEAGGDRSKREHELVGQTEEARARAAKAEDALEVLQRESVEEIAVAEEEAACRASAEAEEKWSMTLAQLQASLVEARAEAKASCEETASATIVGEGALSSELAEAMEELENSRKGLLEWEARVGHVQTALAEKTAEAAAGHREAALFREAVDTAQSALREERETSTAAEARRGEDAGRAEAEIAALRQQLDSAVRSLTEASSGGDQQIEALQKELAAVQEREEREVSEWRRRVEEGARLAREEASQSDRLLAQTEKTLNDRWTLELQNTEVAISRLEEEARVAKEAKEETDKASGARIATMEEENALLKVQAERVEVLVARCARLEEAAASAGENTERRMRGEMEQGREVVRKTEGSVSDLERRLEEALSQLKEKSAVVADLKTKLDEVQAYLSQSEEGREAAQAREAITNSKLRGLEQAAGAAEGRLKEVMADLEDRDGVIAAVEDARVAQERDADRLRERLRGLGKLSHGPQGENGEANGTLEGTVHDDDDTGSVDEGVANGGGRRDELIEGAEYLELLSEHEDLLQLLAQQEVVRKKLLIAVRDIGGQAAARAIMEDAEQVVTNTYGAFVHYADDEEIDGRRDRKGRLQTGELGQAGPVSGLNRRVAV